MKLLPEDEKSRAKMYTDEQRSGLRDADKKFREALMPLGELGDVMIISECDDDCFDQHLDEFSDMGYEICTWCGKYKESYTTTEKQTFRSGYTGTISSSGSVDLTPDTHTSKVEVTKYRDKMITSQFAAKVVPHDKSDEVRKLEDEFLSKRKYYYQIKYGTAVVDVPSKKVSVLFNILFMLSSLLLFACLFFTPSVFRIKYSTPPQHIHYVPHVFALDLFLLNFIPIYEKVVNTLHISVVCVMFVLALACVIALLSVRYNYYRKKFGMSIEGAYKYSLVVTLVVMLCTFALSLVFIVTFDFSDSSYESMLFVYCCIYSLIRVVCYFVVLYDFIRSIHGLIVGIPHNSISSDCVARKKFLDSGEYEANGKLSEKIKTYNIGIDICKYINDLSTKQNTSRWGTRL